MSSALKPVTYHLACSEQFQVEFDGQICRVQSARGQTSEFMLNIEGDEMKIALKPNDAVLSFLVMMDYLFGHLPSLQKVKIENQNELTRQEFFQIPDLWLRRGAFRLRPELWATTQNRVHPVRPKLVPGVQYQRYIPEIQKTLTFRTIDLERDLDTFHEWHNQPRVYDLWELNQSREQLAAYIQKGLADSHQIPLILEFDGEAAGYFEVYWTAEDRLAPYYDYSAFDRGFHFLIGNKKFLGKANTNAALRAISHFMFLDDPRTQKLMAEPRSNNLAVLRYVQTLPGWTFIKEFDFPHKRAALLECRREIYFSENPL